MHIVARQELGYLCKKIEAYMMTREEIAAIDRESEEQHISQQDYLSNHGIARHQYYRWKRKYREADEQSLVPAGFVPMVPGSASAVPSPKVKRQTAEVTTGSGELSDRGDPHVLRFRHAHTGKHDRVAPAGDNIGEQGLVWTVR